MDFDDTDFPPPHSPVAVLNFLAAKHGLINEGEYISQHMRDFLVDVVEECADAADKEWSNTTPGERVRIWMALQTLEASRQLELEYERDYAASEERLKQRRGRA